jgi:hypothetical protein
MSVEHPNVSGGILTSAIIRLLDGDTGKRDAGNNCITWTRFVCSGKQQTRSKDCTQHVLSFHVLLGLVSNVQDTTCSDMTEMSNQDKVRWLVPKVQSVLQKPGLLDEVLCPQIVCSLVDIDRQESQLGNKTLQLGMRNWIITNWCLFEEIAKK